MLILTFCEASLTYLNIFCRMFLSKFDVFESAAVSELSQRQNEFFQADLNCTNEQEIVSPIGNEMYILKIYQIFLITHLNLAPFQIATPLHILLISRRNTVACALSLFITYSKNRANRLDSVEEQDKERDLSVSFECRLFNYYISLIAIDVTTDKGLLDY